MASTCTAHITATTDIVSGTVAVQYCDHHVGHDVQLRHLRLSADVRLEVAQLLQQGATVSKVMDSLRHRIGDTANRDSLLCRLVKASVLIIINTAQSYLGQTTCTTYCVCLSIVSSRSDYVYYLLCLPVNSLI